ncbi:exosome complex exonuclease RRP44 isoform X2 [Battus philenor]|uniref:exosome complex exonuclease RRP44 isoform X2 n=1 Tax=Battus philenor TaxID=42288 RepID=UPI0035D0AD5E
MWTTKTFLTKTKRGNILKIVREHYLRSDLLCGSSACNSCPHKDDEFVLDATPKSICALFDYDHYLILDTNVVLHQIDVLEEDALTNVIILQTVLEEVKHQNGAIFQRLLEIIGKKKRKFYSFVNEHHKDTYVERNPGEKANDRNDRAIRQAASWYASHLSINSLDGKFPQIVLLTDDEKNRKLAQEEGIVCCSVKDYVENINGFVGLVDKLSKNVIPESCSKDALYPAHLTPSQIHTGIRNGKLYQGTFHASRENYLEGSSVVTGFEKPILLQGLIGINRAVDGDIVAIEIFPKEEWRKPSDIVLEDKADDQGDRLEEESELLTTVKPADPSNDEITPTGKVVGIIRRKWRQYCGILKPSKFPGATRHLFTPAERKIPHVRIETRQSDVLASQRILVALDSWPRNSRYPLGHFVRSLGPIGDKTAENEVILLEHDVPHARFSEAVLACLPPDDWTIPQEEINKRVDLRSLCICSVDPPGCTDIDDALHARPIDGVTGSGLKKYEVGVHIADVTHFVRPNTALDKEAALRSTTVYLVDKRIDMVPDLLSSNLCSLRGGEERLAFSCVWELDENANVLSTKFHKSVIKSRSAMTYEEAQLIIDDSSRSDEIASSLRVLNALAKKLKQKRLDNGALLLASPEIRFQVDSETHDPVEVQAKKILDTNSMVEEFMLLANVSVAECLAREFPQCALLRRHPSPPPAYFETFLKAAKQQGFELDVSTNKAFSKSLDTAVIPERPFFNTLLRIMATRCMQQAVYFSSGTRTQDEFYHYGLACPIYTHFTSPIRRYCLKTELRLSRRWCWR